MRTFDADHCISIAQEERTISAETAALEGAADLDLALHDACT
jgi:hypothetical protein